MFDVAIIGAGPAGTAAAYDLLEKGLRVLILDKYEFPRKKACAGGITPKAHHLFKYDISSVINKECRSIKITPRNQTAFFIHHKNPLCYMTRRQDLDLLSLNKVIEKGGDFTVIKKIRSIKETISCVEIRTTDQLFKAGYLIGADGANSIVRRCIARHFFYTNQFALEADVRVDNPDRFPMEFDFSKSLKGYHWIFPKDDHVNIGIYSLGSARGFGIQHLMDYAGHRLFSRRLEAVKGYPICTGGFNYRVDSKRICLAGDAAGLSENLLGEGIFFAVKSGQKAAESIIKSLSSGGDATTLYQNRLKEIQTDLKYYNLSAKWFYRFPWVSMKALSIPLVRNRFVNGYADGKTLTRMIHA